MGARAVVAKLRHPQLRLRAAIRPAHRRAFTIVELLVTIAILALLISILSPLIGRTRDVAMKVICTGRLRDLTLACTMYLAEHRNYPDPMQQASADGSGGVVFRPAPQRISGQLFNQLRPYLNFPPVSASTDVSSLPPFVQCPFVEPEENDRGPFPSAVSALPSYYTGYAYIGRIAETPPPPSKSVTSTLLGLVPILQKGIVLKPGRSASVRDQRRAVVWADNVYHEPATGGTWQFSHARSGPRGGTFIHQSAAELLGQHRGFTDGSVEWVDAGGPDLSVADPVGLDLKASFKSLMGEHWWY